MRIASFFVAKLIFKRKFIRNELKGKKGPLVVIANHQDLRYKRILLQHASI